MSRCIALRHGKRCTRRAVFEHTTKVGETMPNHRRPRIEIRHVFKVCEQCSKLVDGFFDSRPMRTTSPPEGGAR